jgi:hypothetical protein
MPDNIDTATESIYQRIVDNWTLTEFIFEGEDDTALDEGEDSWVLFMVTEIGSNQETLGAENNRRYNRQNLVSGLVHVRDGNGTSEINVIAEAVRTLFEGKAFSDLDFVDGVEIVKVPSPPPSKPDKWQRRNVRAAFTYEFKK